MEIKINAVEVATRLAHRQLIIDFKIKGLKVYEEHISEFVGSKYTEQAQAIFDVHYDYYYDKIIRNQVYPFREGDIYFTLEDGRIIKSVWDDQSVEMHIENPNQVYFRTDEEVIQRWKEMKALKCLSACHELLVRVENEGMIDYHYSKEEVTKMLNNIEHIETKNLLKQ
jgi:hypothetical protein